MIPANNFKIAWNIASDAFGGTAIPICLRTLSLEPINSKLSGNVCSLARSLFVKALHSFQWYTWVPPPPLPVHQLFDYPQDNWVLLCLWICEISFLFLCFEKFEISCKKSKFLKEKLVYFALGTFWKENENCVKFYIPEQNPVKVKIL